MRRAGRHRHQAAVQIFAAAVAGLVATAVAIGASASPAAAAPVPVAGLVGVGGGLDSLGGGLDGGLAGLSDGVGAGLSDGVGAGLSGGVGAGLSGSLGAGASSISSLPELIAFSAVSGLVISSAKFVLNETAKVLDRTTTPQLRSTWFSATYWRMTGIAGVLTLPFLFAAAVQAVLRSDLSLLVRAAFGYLPMAMLAIAVAAPLTMLLLAASDELARAVAGASGGADVGFLARAATLIGGLSAADQSPFLAFLVGGFTVVGALALWIELLMREAAVYVIVLMLPLAFAALVWPARRVWATRAVELLVALVLSKFAIVAVLALGGAAMSASVGTGNVEASIAGLVLLVMAAFSPWAVLRFVPVAELAAGAVGGLRNEIHQTVRSTTPSPGEPGLGNDITTLAMAAMRRDAGAAQATETAAREAAARGAEPVRGPAAGAGEADPDAGAAGAEPDLAAAEVDASPTAGTSPERAPRSGPTSTPGSGPADAPGSGPTGTPPDFRPAAAPPVEPADEGAAESATADAATATPDLIPALAHRMRADHELYLGVKADGTPGWRTSPDERSPTARGAPAAEPFDASPSTPPPQDGGL